MDTRGIDYRPIRLDRKEVRLLEIQNGNSVHDPLVSRLITCKVTPDLEYVGLSTLWRDQDDNHTEVVWVNNRRVVVPATVGQALRNVRAFFVSDQEYLSQTASNTSSNQPLTAASAPPPSSSTCQQHHKSSRTNSLNSDSVTSNSSSSTPQQQPLPSQQVLVTTAPPPPPASTQRRKSKTPSWLKQLLRGFKSILPDDSDAGARKAPLRVWVDCLCMDLKNDAESAQRRSHVALAYSGAKITVGWLGLKDDTSDTAIAILRKLDAMCPPGFGSPEDRVLHPENYSPCMQWLAPMGAEWAADAAKGGGGGGDGQGAMYTAATKFLSRPYFHRQWIVEELTLSKFPAFLMGDEIVSWMQLLIWNRMNGELSFLWPCFFFFSLTNLPKLQRNLKSQAACISPPKSTSL